MLPGPLQIVARVEARLDFEMARRQVVSGRKVGRSPLAQIEGGLAPVVDALPGWPLPGALSRRLKTMRLWIS